MSSEFIFAKGVNGFDWGWFDLIPDGFELGLVESINLFFSGRVTDVLWFA